MMHICSVCRLNFKADTVCVICVGVGVPVMFAQLDMDVVVPGVAAGAAEGRAEIEDGDDLVAAVNLSAYWQPTDSLNLGLL